jgi:hypothetical protein
MTTGFKPIRNVAVDGREAEERAADDLALKLNSITAPRITWRSEEKTDQFLKTSVRANLTPTQMEKIKFLFHSGALKGKAARLLQTDNSPQGSPLGSAIFSIGKDPKTLSFINPKLSNFFPLQFNRAYIRYSNTLFYVTQQDGICAELELDPQEIHAFDSKIKPNATQKKLSDEQIQWISDNIGYTPFVDFSLIFGEPRPCSVVLMNVDPSKVVEKREDGILSFPNVLNIQTDKIYIRYKDSSANKLFYVNRKNGVISIVLEVHPQELDQEPAEKMTSFDERVDISKPNQVKSLTVELQQWVTDRLGHTQWLKDDINPTPSWDSETEIVVDSFTRLDLAQQFFESDTAQILRKMHEMQTTLQASIKATQDFLKDNITENTDSVRSTLEIARRELEKNQKQIQSSLLEVNQKLAEIKSTIIDINYTFDGVASSIEEIRAEGNAQRNVILQQIGSVQAQQQRQLELTEEGMELSAQRHEALVGALDQISGNLTRFVEEERKHQKLAIEEQDKIQTLLERIQGNSVFSEIKQKVDEILLSAKGKTHIQEENLALKEDTLKGFQALAQQNQQLLEIHTDTKPIKREVRKKKVTIAEESFSTSLNSTLLQVEQSVPSQLPIESVFPAIPGIDPVVELSESVQKLKKQSPQDQLIGREILEAVQAMRTAQASAQQAHEAGMKELRQICLDNQEQGKTLLEKMELLSYEQQKQKESMVALSGFFKQRTDKQIDTTEKVFQDEKVNYFYHQLKTAMEDFYTTMKDVKEKKRDPDQSGVESLTEGMRMISEFIPLPFLQLGVDVLGKAIVGANKVIIREEAEKIDRFVDEELSIIESVVLHITHSYERQLKMLTFSGLRELAESAVKRVFNFLISQKEKSYTGFNDTQKIELLLQGIIDGDPHNSINTDIETVASDIKWSAEGLFKRSGLQIEGTEKFYTRKKQSVWKIKDPNETRPDKYGFRWVSQEEFSKLQGFNPCTARGELIPIFEGTARAIATVGLTANRAPATAGTPKTAQFPPDYQAPRPGGPR